MVLHKGFGEVFAAFEHGSRLGRTNDGNVLQLGILLEEVIDSLHKGVFGTHDDHIDCICHNEGFYTLEVICLQGHVFTD